MACGLAGIDAGQINLALADFANSNVADDLDAQFTQAGLDVIVLKRVMGPARDLGGGGKVSREVCSAGSTGPTDSAELSEGLHPAGGEGGRDGRADPLLRGPLSVLGPLV